ncbi:alanine:cation symporter family protein [Clostridium ganghwense]|uniref:Alanine:cation symporter family protein n=1 Tax=Clostridium ganghwense TaxID=312089 RepID=A0ABT4CM01_9CLOT|nr:alanine:cation symporter family protein [Clostridium ganghwense]MCY6369266.1 alanine:cation symporter family protein [Clostridium ganghwense]
MGVDFIVEVLGQVINLINGHLWNLFLPLLIISGTFVTYRTIKLFNIVSEKDKTKGNFSKMKSSLSISLSSKVGTGAIIGVLTAMWKTSSNGIGGESIVLWVIIGMFLLVPLTYSEVLFSQITMKTPRDFIDYNINKKAGAIYTVCLVILYSFGFVGFQLTGIQSVVKIFSRQNFNYQFTQSGLLFYIILPLILAVSIIVITKNHKLFINTLGSMISLVILIYAIFFMIFLFLTIEFVPEYISFIWKDFIKFKSASIGIPIGFIIGFQRIIQISETGLGTSALASSDAENSPRREALIQTISTVITTFIAVVITSYVFTYGRYNLANVKLSGNGFERISGYLTSVVSVTGDLGAGIIIIFFILSGLTTVLGAFHFLNRTMHISQNKRIIFYISLITLSGILSVSNFDVIFDAADLLMFIVASINILAMFIFVIKYIKNFKIK